MMNFSENEVRTIEVVFDELSRMDYSKLNSFLGSMTIKDVVALACKLRHAGYCERHGISYEDMTEEDFEIAAFERLEEY